MAPPTQDLQERLDRFSMPEPNTGCVLWFGSRSTDGYARMKINGRDLQVHRVVFERRFGAIGEDLHLDHLCRVRCCVNPDHLEPVTLAENNRRAALVKTHCANGHALSGANLYITPRGWRSCFTCRRAKSRAHRERMKEQHVA